MSQGTKASTRTAPLLANSRVVSELAEDGLLLDILVKGTTKLDWDRILKLLRTSDLATDVSSPFDSIEKLDVSHVFGDSTEDSQVALNVELSGSAYLSCNFYCEEEIEFNIDPKQLTVLADIDRVLDFMRQVGNLLNKPVSLAPEGRSDKNLAVYQPALGEFYCDE